MSAATRANFRLQAVCPEQTQEFADRHDAIVWNCSRTILGTPSAPAIAQVVASLALSVGGLGLTSAHRGPFAAHWASGADCIFVQGSGDGRAFQLKYPWIKILP